MSVCIRERHRFISILLNIDSEIHARTNAKWQRNRVSKHLDTITDSIGRSGGDGDGDGSGSIVMYLLLHAISSTTYAFPTFASI